MSSGFRVVYVCSGCWRILAECQGLVSRGRVERHVHDAGANPGVASEWLRRRPAPQTE